ncbi:tripartite tricarboxylate transporter substrate binding protein [Comamonas antarctica]|uniref:Tripartite tricarboxylate transporter substrate binding protein n=1 Tax=Comamonas antarctica TaxID=2743470 RepID=A0A6N1X7T3_9BURK|nr:tripartite tricarboxylate transporter substrate binding protein [Comamonas antarctica]QKV55407.1 tripartite tricarboxylate transporter substrate binding protein [Comamonas antarctica]
MAFSIKISALALAALGAVPLAALAQPQWPAKPVTIVVAYPAGGAADMLARLVAPKMSAVLGQPVVIENRGGAAGQIGAGYVAQARADGYTLLVDGGGYAINPTLFPKLPYDPAKAFAPVGILGVFPLVLTTSPTYSAKTTAELVQAARAAPDAVSYASPGTGSTQHLATEQFLQQAKVKMVHIPYKGGSPAMADVMGGHVPVYVANIGSSLPNMKAGKLRPLAVMAARRSPLLPDVPTLAEAGVAHAEAYEWNGMFMPAGVPPAVAAKLTAALKTALEAPDVKERITSVGGEPFTGGTAEVKKFIDLQAQRMGKVMRDGNIRAE